MSYESWRVETKYAGVWTDITSFVDTVRAPIDIVRGRDTWRDDITPSRLSLQLRNADQRFSPGNTTSAYALRSAQEIRVSDRWGGVEYPLFHGFVELPSIDEWQKSDTAAPRDQSIAVSAVDKLGRLERSRSFVSMLTEHVLHVGGSALTAYWPILDGAGSTVAYHYGPVAQGVLEVERRSDASSDVSPVLLAFGVVPGPPGDDGSYPEFTPVLSGSTLQLRARLVQRALAGLSLSGYLTIVHWYYPTAQNASLWQTMVARDDSFTNSVTFRITAAGLWQAAVATGAGSASIDGDGAKWDQWQLVGLRLNVSSGAIEFWVDAGEFSGSLGGASSGDIDSILVDAGSPGASAGHLQVYLGDVDAFTHDMFLAQREVGWRGHARQSVRDRVELVLAYAGVDAAAMQLDPTASTPMQRARLAGRTPAQVLAEAVETEQGLLFTSARDHGHRHGDVVLHARQRRYNPPLAATVDLSWLEPPLSFRTDPPTNDMSVTRVGAGTARAQHAASVDEFGVYASSATLDTAIDADPANLAAFTVRQHAAPRQRIPRLVLHLRETTDPARAATILGRELGDQVALAGLPVNAPWDVGRFHIEGIRHSISIAGHRVEWNTGPVVGDIPGVPTPYPLVGVSVVRAETKIPY